MFPVFKKWSAREMAPNSYDFRVECAVKKLCLGERWNIEDDAVALSGQDAVLGKPQRGCRQWKRILKSKESHYSLVRQMGKDYQPVCQGITRTSEMAPYSPGSPGHTDRCQRRCWQCWEGPSRLAWWGLFVFSFQLILTIPHHTA